jgi:peptidoglycan/xylan/chitin deacetylase (PgdA/CDA1 family)
MLKALKCRLLRVARGVRLLELVAGSEWRRRRLLILCYHSLAVDQEHQWRRPLFFTPEEFDARLDLVRRARLNVLPLGEAVMRLKAGTLPERSAVLTFDDGSADFHDLVAPRLLRLGYPATVYVTTYYIEKRLPIFPLMTSYLLWKGRDRRLEADPALGLAHATSLTELAQRARAEEAIVARADELGLSAEVRDALAGDLAARVGVDYAELRRLRVLELMSPDEIGSVSAQGFDVQLHTHRHRTPPRRDDLTDEILENRRRIEAMTRRAAEHFCYPRGVHLPNYPAWLASLGVVTGTTCDAGLAAAESSSLLLPRLVDTAVLTAVEIEGWLSGFSQLLPRRRSS